ncbi:carbohydrate ABC transporter permease [Microbacterium sp. F51-2R]|uniref:carbohydrate ABC transporter permease n=1 Tax=Microbacterium sp. F51-2R TaxID=3445777 RepID=UPI003F9F47CA
MVATVNTTEASPRDAGPNPSRPARRRRGGSSPSYVLWVLPAAAFYLFVTIIPSIRGVFYALTDWNGLDSEFDFVGLDNFVAALTDPLTLAATAQTIFYVIVVTVAVTVLGLLLSVGLTSAVRSRNILRVIFFTPFVVTPVVLSFVWKYMYAPDSVMDGFALALGLPDPDWLGDPALAKWAVALSIVWQFTGLAMVVFIAGMQSIPHEVTEAAHLDGASARQRFFSITLPLLRPASTIVIVLTVLTCIKLFDQVWVLTQGGPGNSTQTLSTALYQQAFTYGNFGEASVLGLLVAVLGLTASLIQIRIQRGGRS